MATADLKTTSFDPDELKLSLIEFLQSTDEFGDFNYDGSAINTVVDLLTRNTTYNAYLANMLANESFIDSAQLRANVVSHAQKLSYTPRSCVAARASGTVKVTPSSTLNLDTSIEMPQGSSFLSSVDGQTYSFVTNDTYILPLISNSYYELNDVTLYQGQRLTNRFVYAGDPIVIQNSLIDTNTMVVSVEETTGTEVYLEADSINELSRDSRVYFLSETSNQRYQIEFGRDVLGKEPNNSAIITISYILTEVDHANGLDTFISATTVDGYSNVTFTADSEAWGGSDREDIEDIRFIAPKIYQAQDRALTDTDYIPLIKREYPFIEQVITWGGETNDPPQYGKVFISVISEDQGSLLSSAAKDSIVSYLADYNVGSITPEIVDPIAIGMDVEVQFDYDSRITSKTFNQLSGVIGSIVEGYNSGTLNAFDRYYNDSYLTGLIMDIKGIESVNIEKTVYRNFDVLRFVDPIYTVNFMNPIKPGTVTMSDFAIASNGLSHKLYDENGIIYVTYTVGGQSTITEVGEIDYDTGEVSFVLNMIQDADIVRLHAEPLYENFYVGQRTYIFINDINYSRLSENR